VYRKHLRIALNWAGSALAVAGLVLGLYRVVRGPHRAAMAIAVTFPFLYFYFVSHQHLVFARYLLPIIPFLCLLAAAAVIAAVDWLWRRGFRPLTRSVLIVGLVLATMVPPARTSVNYNADAARVWTSELAYNWIRQNVPPGSAVTIESQGLLLPPVYRTDHVVQLRQHPYEYYVEHDAQYLVASSQRYSEFVAHPEAHPDEYSDYVRIFQQTQELARFTPSAEHPGPELRVLKVTSR
jgi:hypothetical protein